MLLGYRFLRMDENVTIREDLTITDPGPLGVPLAVGTMLQVTDIFDTETEFHGADLGFNTTWQRGRWSMELLTKVAVGTNRTRLKIDGSTLVTVPGAGQSLNAGGLLALPSNIGELNESTFAMVPELGLTLGYCLTPRLRATVGYNLIYWPGVLRAAEQINLDIDPSQLLLGGGLGGDGTRPVLAMDTNDVWVHGLTAGLDWRW
jgi:hypothetical protein